MSAVDISIVIVNWKVRPLLEKCLNAIIADTVDFNTEIFVIDNDSRDGSPEMIMAEYPQVTMIALPSNRGFAAANNLGLKQARGKYLFLLNPDTEVQPGFFKTIFKYLEANPEVGIVGPKILNSDLSLQPSVRRFPDLTSQLLTLLKLQNVWPDNKVFDRYFAKDFDYSQEQIVDQIMGAAIVITREAFENIGLLDQRFFIWFEEVDYCRRAKKKGIVIKYLPTATVLHHGGSSFAKQQTFQNQLVFSSSLFYYFLKHQALWKTLIILLVIPINLILSAGYAWWTKHYQKF